MTHKPNTWPFMASEAVRNGTGGGGADGRPAAPTQQQDEATPGKGENQAGFIKPQATPLQPTEPHEPRSPHKPD
jgi:hypothetical protein